VAGVVAAAGVTVSQLTPLVFVAETVKFKAELAPLTAMVWAGGAAPPILCENARDAGVALIVPTTTCKVTGIVTGLSITGSPDGLVTVTVMLPV
jgi:hypothetical protein